MLSMEIGGASGLGRATVAGLAILAICAIPAGSAGVKRSCTARGATVVAHSSSVVVLRLTKHPHPFGDPVVLCSRRTGRAFSLNDPSTDQSVWSLRLRGPYLEYVLEADQGVSEDYYAFAIDGRTGRVAAATDGLNPPFRVILKADGALVTATGNGLPGFTEPGGEVRVYDHDGYRLLASSLGIMPLSLISSPGKLVQWRDGQQESSASVAGLGTGHRYLPTCRTITTCRRQYPDR